MVRVWFGDESQGLKRDRQDYVLTIERRCADADTTKKFYCDGLGFKIVGISRNIFVGKGSTNLFLNHPRMPSFSINLIESSDNLIEPDDFLLDIGMWDRPEWEACRERLKELGFAPTAEKTANPFQMTSDYADPDGFKVRLTCTERPKNTGKAPDFGDGQ